jgi:hypothetical protein
MQKCRNVKRWYMVNLHVSQFGWKANLLQALLTRISKRSNIIIGNAIKLIQAPSGWAPWPSAIDAGRHLQQPQPLGPSSPWPPLAVPWSSSSSVAEGWWQGLGACESEAQHCFSPSSEATTVEICACEMATRCLASSASASSALGTRAAVPCCARLSARSSCARTS